MQRAIRVGNRLGSLLLDLFLPASCLACGALEPSASRDLGLCSRCLCRVLPLPEPQCPRCAQPLPGTEVPEGFLCSDCRHRAPPYERLIVGWAYQPPIDKVILGLKFGGLRYLGARLAAGLAPLATKLDPPADFIVPVPLHWRRRLLRGYNQSSEIAEPLAKRLELPLVNALRRQRATRPQMLLALEDRKQNLRRAFLPRTGIARPTTDRIEGRNVLLVDDVVTSGATLASAAECLRRAGARTVYAAAAARAPKPGSGPIARPDVPPTHSSSGVGPWA